MLDDDDAAPAKFGTPSALHLPKKVPWPKYEVIHRIAVFNVAMKEDGTDASDFLQHRYLFSSISGSIVLQVIFETQDLPDSDPYFNFFELKEYNNKSWHGLIKKLHYRVGSKMEVHPKPTGKRTRFLTRTKEFILELELPKNGDFFAFDVDVEGVNDGQKITFRALHDPEVGNGPPE